MGCCKERDPLKAAVWHALNYYAYEDASFLAERLFLESRSSETLYLLATCYFRQNRASEAYDLLKRTHSTAPKCRLLFAQCCLKLNKLFEGEQILIGNTTDTSLAAIDSNITSEFQELAGICFSVLAKIYRKCHRLEHAVYFYRCSLKRNPFLWSNYANLCQAGEKDNPDEYFKATSCPTFVTSPSPNNPLNDLTNDINLVSDKISPYYAPKNMNSFQALAHSTPIPNSNIPVLSQVSAGNLTPDNRSIPELELSETECNTPSPSILRKQVCLAPYSRNINGDSLSGNKVRRSSRLMSNGRGIKSKENDRKASNKASRQIPLVRPVGTHDTYKKGSNTKRDLLNKVMNLFSHLGQGYQALCQFECKRAIQLFQKLPRNHYNSGWVLSHAARALYEMTEYTQAIRLYQSVHQAEVSRCNNLAYYSTCLWHTQREVELSALAHQMLESNKNSPETWCAVGNCFSLQKEHETAIKFFERSVMVDPEYTYGYTLLGHEYSYIDELDDAMNCYRHAVRIDPRHYNAWYGIGRIYFRQEKHDLALCHFRKAQAINHSNAPIMAHVAVVLNAMKKHKEALKVLVQALEYHPKHPLCKFHKASTLLCLEQCDDALQELDELQSITPTESLIYFLKAKIHRKVGNSHLAMMHFSWAMDLDPQGSNNHIKEAIDKHYQSDDISVENS